MTDERDGLLRAARQLIETDRLLGADFMPAGQKPLPQIPPASAGLNVSQKAQALEAIAAEEISVCTRCPLCESRANTVPGEGNPDAELVFIGEGPGVEEDKTGRPFVGRAGELLTKMIGAMGLTRRDVFIANMVKCRPPGNRAPAPDEVAACWDYLVRQLQIIQPTVIVTLGNPATQNLLDTRVGITRMRGTWQSLGLIGDGLAGIDVMPTFHPAYLLRQYTPDNRRKVWSDLRQVMDRLGMDAPREG